MNKSNDKHAVLVWELVAGCDGFDKGARYKIESIAGDEFFVSDHSNMKIFLDFHGCIAINKDKMEQLRNERVKESME